MKDKKEITGFKDYFVTDNGKIYTTKESWRLGKKAGELRELQLANHKTGYKYANIYSGSGKQNRHSVRVHRLVWQEWKGLIPEGYYVDHINGNKSDNRLENLQLLTPSQNAQKYHKIDKNKNNK